MELGLYETCFLQKSTLQLEQTKMTETQVKSAHNVSQFRNWIVDDEGADFPAEPDRYHLYISRACPFANRATIVRNLKGLQGVISQSLLSAWLVPEKSWQFGIDGGEEDPNNPGFKSLREVYWQSDPNKKEKFTVPCLYDKKKKRVVSDDSGDITIMLNSVFNKYAKNPELDLYPVEQRQKIDEMNNWIMDNINAGVYKIGFAKTQEAYEHGYDSLFAALDKVENILSKNKYVLGDKLTLADVRLFGTLIRFDEAYHGLFKCNRNKLIEFPNLWSYTLELYQMPEIRETVNFDHIKDGYYKGFAVIHFGGISVVPKGPLTDYDAQPTRKL
jgi:putative glutathione S-transferase